MEPNPFVLKQLRRNTRAEPGTKILHAALGFEDGEREFFFLAKGVVKGRLSKVANHLGSFSKDQVQKSIGYLAQRDCRDLRIESTRVATIHWETLLQSYDLHGLDLVALDTEGYDVELLDAFPFEMTTPSVIVFEYMWSHPSDLEKIRERLERYCYILLPAGHDCVCVHSRCFRRTSRWMYLQK
jgi:FkbM family methyltransferase